MAINRRQFIGAAALAAGGMAAGRAFAAPAAKDGMVWANLLHFGMNSWRDVPLKEAQLDKIPAERRHAYKVRCMADYLRSDIGVWNKLVDATAKSGANMLVIDMAEGVFLPSHPELAVKGTWSVERFQKELDRIRAMGLEVIPKMNFSTAHSSWQKEYRRMTSTKRYYQVCADVISDVIDIFRVNGKPPRFFHLGYDEETAAHQQSFLMAIVRQGDLWWHDFNWFVKQIESKGVRPWIWSDYYWHHPKEFLSKMPKSVLQSNWYYGAEFDVSKMSAGSKIHVQAYEDFAKAGFDQVPTGANWSNDVNFGRTVKFCREKCPADHLKGFMMASWQRTIPEELDKGLAAIGQLGTEIKNW